MSHHCALFYIVMGLSVLLWVWLLSTVLKMVVSVGEVINSVPIP